MRVILAFAFFGFVGCAADSDPAPGGDNVLLGSGSLPDGGFTATDSGQNAEDGGTLGTDAGMDAGTNDAGAEDSGTPDPCDAATEYTLTSTEATEPEYVHALVEVTGTLTTSDAVCRTDECAPEDACCGDCETSLYLDNVVRLRTSDCFALPVGCFGDACIQGCRPATSATPITLKGVLQASPRGPAIEIYEVIW